MVFTYITFCLYVQNVDGGKRVSEKKLANWSNKNKHKDDVSLKTVDLKNNPEIVEQGNDLGDLLAVIQYIITDVLNNNEFRQFIIKRFLHNSVPQST